MASAQAIFGHLERELSAFRNTAFARIAAAIRFRVKKEQFVTFYGLLAERQGHNLALTVSYVLSLPANVHLEHQMRVFLRSPHLTRGSSLPAKIRQSRPDYGLGLSHFQFKSLYTV